MLNPNRLYRICKPEDIYELPEWVSGMDNTDGLLVLGSDFDRKEFPNGIYYILKCNNYCYNINWLVPVNKAKSVPVKTESNYET